jgi:hypothetical protein
MSNMGNESEEKAIRETLDYYVEGMRTGNVGTLKEGFHEQAILCGYLGDEKIVAPIVGLYDWVSSNEAPAKSGAVFHCAILTIEVNGRVAAATVRETSHEEVVIDYFHLLKEEDRWRIVSKLWDVEPAFDFVAR